LSAKTLYIQAVRPPHLFVRLIIQTYIVTTKSHERLA